MKKLMELKKRKKNNKGFSLVELIIVIAIMAVLVAVLAPQFLKYVEKSRNSTDAQNATAIVTALQTYYADPNATDVPATGTSGTVTVSKDGAVAGGTGTTTFTNAALKEAGFDIAITKDLITCKSKSTWTEYTVTWTAKDGTLSFSYSQTGGTAGAFEKMMLGKATTTSQGTT